MRHDVNMSNATSGSVQVQSIESDQFFTSVLDDAEFGIVVIDTGEKPVYMNARARNFLEAPDGTLPEWIIPHLNALREALTRSEQVVERWAHDDMMLRVRARQLQQPIESIVLELTVYPSAGGRRVVGQLARGLHIPMSDAKLLALLWHGKSNDEIAEAFGVRVGTIKSRLYRLYQRLGVNRRPAAVLRAAEVLSAASV